MNPTDPQNLDHPLQGPGHGLTAVDLFCGSGAVTWGLKKAGFKVLAAVDVDEIACKTYKMNHPEVKIFKDDVTKLLPDAVKEHVPETLDLLAICAPCQPFSTQNRKRLRKDDRTGLLLATLPFIKLLRPRAIFVENVPGLAKTEILPAFLDGLTLLGYDSSNPVVVDAADLGVPQRRKRTIMYACRAGAAGSVDFKALGRRDRTTVRDWIAHLPSPPVGKPHPGGDFLHCARAHMEITLRRLRHVSKNGGSRQEIPKNLQLDCHKTLSPSKFPDTYGRLAWDRLAPTITTGCTDLTRGRFAHPEEDRAITAREAACLQTFDESYHFFGNRDQIATQIGNAVPPMMMQALAEHMIPSLINTMMVPLQMCEGFLQHEMEGIKWPD